MRILHSLLVIGCALGAGAATADRQENTRVIMAAIEQAITPDTSKNSVYEGFAFSVRNWLEQHSGKLRNGGRVVEVIPPPVLDRAMRFYFDQVEQGCLSPLSDQDLAELARNMGQSQDAVRPNVSLIPTVELWGCVALRQTMRVRQAIAARDPHELLGRDTFLKIVRDPELVHFSNRIHRQNALQAVRDLYP